MPTGPQGQKRPADVVGCAVHVCKVLTGEIEESPVKVPDARRVAAASAGGKARAKKLTRTRRREIGRAAVTARWARS